eukprot:TRINITY_DN12185_c0_g1_i1.p1 TRINITY_DN12185_c0_g1~~TRINITY_DN12185_c0_g1_i1.p1  ORF type:complete len:824 (-),score=194.20 TRINITY_DN12185_c0_g1_i1:45-2516(-)
MNKQRYSIIFIIIAIFHVSSLENTLLHASPSANHFWKFRQSMEVGLSDFTASTVGEKGIYLIGGCGSETVSTVDFNEGTSQYDCDEVADSVIIYQPKSDSYTTLVSLPTPRYRHSAAVYNELIYIFGGINDSGDVVNEVEIFNTLTNEWVDNDFTYENYDFCAVTVENSIYLIGGYDNATAVNTVHKFDTDTGDFEESVPMLEQRANHGCVVLDDKIFVFGGESISTIESINILADDEWFAEEQSSSTRSDKAIAALNDKLYVFGGASGDDVLNDISIYVPSYIPNAKGNWFYGGELPSRRFRFAATTFQDSIFVFGGLSGLVGENGVDGSYYPIVSRVDEFLEVVPGSLESTPISLHGAGTTNPSKYFWKIMEDLETQARLDVTLTYRAVGSSTGIEEFINQENGYTMINHFGSGDLPIPHEQYENMTEIGNHEVIHFPIAIGAVSVFFNFPTSVLQEYELDLDACLLARIFSRDIINWNHEDIVASNSFLEDVDQPIKVVHRVHGSSSTSGLTQYFKLSCPESWTLDFGSTIAWPEGTYEAQGSGNLVQFLVDNEYSIGYLEAGHGHSRNLPEVSLLNKAGNYVNTLIADIGAAATVAIEEGLIPSSGTEDFSNVSLLNMDGENTWPITLFTYVYVRRDLTGLGESASLLVAFLEYALSESSQNTMDEVFGFVQLPTAVKELNSASLSLLELPFDSIPFVFETSATTQAITGAGERVISGKRNRYVDVAIIELYEKIEALEEIVELLQESQNYEQLSNTVSELEGDIQNLKDNPSQSSGIAGNTALILGILSFVLGAIALFVSVIAFQKASGAKKSSLELA